VRALLTASALLLAPTRELRETHISTGFYVRDKQVTFTVMLVSFSHPSMCLLSLSGGCVLLEDALFRKRPVILSSTPLQITRHLVHAWYVLWGTYMCPRKLTRTCRAFLCADYLASMNNS
jgi:hypothetical protein